MHYDFETLTPPVGKNLPFVRTTHTHTPEHPEAVNLGVAEMKFPLLPAIADVLRDAASLGALGYVTPTPEFDRAVVAWQKARHDWDLDPAWYTLVYGVVPAIGFALRTFTKEGDGVIVQLPIYTPFLVTVRKNNRRLVENRLVANGNRWEINFDELERQAADPHTTAMILCSPHNPTGRVWTPDELSRIADICRRNGVYVISDEIHADLILPGYTHTMFSKIAGGARHTLLTAPSKTFSIPGLTCAFSITPDPDDRRSLAETIDRDMGGYTNVPGILACGAGYTHGGEWLDECCEVLARNTEILARALKTYIPDAKLYDAQGTYLRWVDFSCFGLDPKGLEALFARAHFPTHAGAMYDTRENRCARINVACPSRYIEPAVERLARAAGL
ncbi:MAG: aminotransferase class I/II-fold pyridoxal phosphate-dependent enzyme [Clostridiaceae bacterium]|nr:aminotransferase class I/II-fold pyridoxal phosphate-dependent enzyme [Clostridiaceae bacterium]